MAEQRTSVYEEVIEEAVAECYAYDGDSKRNSIRYFAPPEDYVRIAYEAFRKAGLIRGDSAD